MSVRFRSSALLLTVLMALFLFMSVQRSATLADDSGEPLTPQVGEAVGFAISPAISDLQDEEVPPPDTEGEEPPDLKMDFRGPASDAGEGSIDGAIFPSPTGDGAEGFALNVPRAAAPAPIASFDGLIQQDSFLPPDTVGDVGPNHYVEMTNIRFRVFSKTGVPLTASVQLSAVWAGLGIANRCSTVNDGDPIVLYDPLADRWLLSQFCVAVANPNNHMLVAISTSGDPTGTYFLYDFMMPNNKFNDYPHFGVWRDAYYMTDHQFNQAGTLWLGQGTYAYDRTKMVAGDPTAKFIYFDLFGRDPDVGGMLPSDMDGLNPPPAGTPDYFMNWRADEFGDPADAIQLWEFHADFANPSASTFTERPESRIPVPAFDPRVPSTSPNVIEQPGATASQFLDAIQDRFMHRLAYRNFGGQESLVANHTVNVGPNPATAAGHQAAPRYYELRRTLPGGVFTLVNAATFAPDANNRWMGSAAQDNQGNIGLGYSVSSTTVSPSVRFTGRLATDPPNTLESESTIVTGSGRQTSNSGRWGDYSAMSVDPSDDCTFFYAQEYYNSVASASWRTRIGSFKFPVCTPAAKGALQGTITDCNTGLPISGALVQATGGYLRSSGATGTYSMNTVPGTYDLSASRAGYLPASASGFVVTDTAMTTGDLCLVPIPVVATAGIPTPTVEGCNPNTGGLDPGETVSVAFSLKNTGAADTTDLVATLLATGGVISPGGPQSYGVLTAGGAAASRTFTFTVDPNLGCADSLTAILSLQDGSTDLGTQTFTVALGAFFTERFDGVTAPALPAGWVDSFVGIGPSPWATTTIPGYFVSFPNGVFTGSSASASERRLESPVIPVPPIPTQLSFQNNWSLQANNDGAVLEISINGGAYADVIAAGGSFVSGGYNGTISSASSAINGRQAWTAANTAGSNGFVLTRVNLPAAALGQSVTLRWRSVFNTGTSQAGGGWRIDDVMLRTSTCCGPIVTAAPPAAVTGESCIPANGGADPDETVTVSFPLQNTGTASTTALVATLLPGGGVNAPSGPQNYGVVTAGGPAVSRSFTFVPGGTCGGTLTATLAIQDGSTPLGNRTFTLTMGGTTTVFSQNFDGVTAPALPAGWVATRPLGASPALWATSSTAANRVSAPNGAITTGSTTTGDNRLDSPVFAVPAGVSAQLSFNNNWSLEDGFDGGVLEISVNGGAFTDILDAGGSFISGGYSGELSFEAGGPLAGRHAWTGSGIFGSNGFVSTKVNLPAAALGASVQLRWRAGFDASGNPSGAGWRIDDVVVSSVSCCVQACALGCPSDIFTDNEPGMCGKAVSFAAPTVSGSCGTVATAPASGSLFDVGMTPVTSTGTSVSGGGTTGTCSFNVSVADVQDPTITCPSDIVTGTDPGLCSAVVSYPAPVASDNCSVTVSTDVPSGSAFPKGVTTVHGLATDASGRTAACSFTVTVNDTEAPTISVTLTPSLLWPPNHQMIPIGASVLVADNCAAAAVLSSLTSNEPDDAVGNGDGNTANDIQNGLIGTLDLAFDFRAERAGGGQGRIYTATYTATDGAGNTASASGTSFVPHDQSGVEDPVRLTVDLSGDAALLSWNSVASADSYSVIRGDVASLKEDPNFINLGTVSCLEAATQQTSRSDADVPTPGQFFFYVVAYHHGQSSTYGAPTAAKPRVPGGGTCP